MAKATKAPTALRLAIAASGLSQHDVAIAAGVNPTMLSRLVNGAPAGEKTREKVATALGRPVDELWSK